MSCNMFISIWKITKIDTLTVHTVTSYSLIRNSSWDLRLCILKNPYAIDALPKIWADHPPRLGKTFSCQEMANVYSLGFQPRQSSLAFRMGILECMGKRESASLEFVFFPFSIWGSFDAFQGMMSQTDESGSSRFQEMTSFGWQLMHWRADPQTLDQVRMVAVGKHDPAIFQGDLSLEDVAGQNIRISFFYFMML